MGVDPALEAPQAAPSDAVTVAFGDLEAGVFGIARTGTTTGEEGPVESGLGILFADGALVEVRAESGEVSGVQASVEEPLREWTVAFSGEDGTLGFDLRLHALSAPAAVPPGSDVARLGGMQGYEQLVSVEGTVRAGGAPRRVSCRGQRGHSWGAPDWERLSLARTIGLWLDGDAGVSLTALRPAKSGDHAGEVTAATLFTPEPVAIAEPRVSTTYDGEGRQRSAGLELYVGDGDDEIAHRAAGEVVCGTSLDLGRLRLDTAFLRWRMEGREGVGRYDVLRRA